MTRKALIIVSLLRDALDLMIIGQIPGLNIALNLPVLFMHYRFAGPLALTTLFECAPGIETLPMFTVAALNYPDPVAATNAKTVDAHVVDGSSK